MKKKILITALMILTAGGAAFYAMDGVSWLDAKGLRGPEKQITSRVNAYWQARMRGDMQQMAKYLHPLQSDMLSPGMLATEKYEVGEVAVDGDAATAHLTVTSRLKHPLFSARTRTVNLKSQWVRYENQWYRALKPVGLHEAIKYDRGEWVPPTAAQAEPVVDETAQSVNP